MTGWYKAGNRWHAAREGHNRSLCGRYPAPAGLDTAPHGKACVTCSDLAATRYVSRETDPSWVCTCDGCWCCGGHVTGCTCDVDWDELRREEQARRDRP